MRFETHDSASMLFRHVDIDIAAYPMLAWRWYIELPIRSPLDERTHEGDDHPARLFQCWSMRVGAPSLSAASRSKDRALMQVRNRGPVTYPARIIAT